MKYRFLLLIGITFIIHSCDSNRLADGTYQITIFSTNDIHGKFFPFDYVDSMPIRYSLSAASVIINNMREETGKERVVLIDNGDHLQGDNSVYYYNFVDTTSKHIFSEIVSWLDYDAVIVGNHDIEAGHPVYDRLFKQDGVPYIAANIINLKKGLPYFKPYKIIEKNGLRIAVIGMTNPNIKKWLSEDLLSGMEFEEILPSLQNWVDKVIKDEKPHLVIAAIHAGLGEEGVYEVENPARYVAANTKGIDIIFAAHDHKTTSEKVFNGKDSVLLMEGGGRAAFLSEADVSIVVSRGQITKKEIQGNLISLQDVMPDENFLNHFKSFYDSVTSFTNRKIGSLLNRIDSKDAFKGPSAYIDMIHNIQLENSGADISFAAPLTLNVTIEPKELNFQDMFNIYPFENQLYVITMTGNEIKNYLEYSYSKWINKIPSESGHLLKINLNGRGERGKFQNPYFNFDSAAGIIYEVSTVKDYGERITIKSMANGDDFIPEKKYLVALSSYRANGGGDILLNGSKLTKDVVEKRVVKKLGDIREILYEQIKRDGFIKAVPLNHWKFVPDKESSNHINNDLDLLF
ncbi:MAG: bifunctional UDP-sugar hydrolase/5'-nucleotidase [Bacteroidales bacterium]